MAPVSSRFEPGRIAPAVLLMETGSQPEWGKYIRGRCPVKCRFRFSILSPGPGQGICCREFPVNVPFGIGSSFSGREILLWNVPARSAGRSI